MKFELVLLSAFALTATASAAVSTLYGDETKKNGARIDYSRSEADPETLCVARDNQGCCSNNLGVKGIGVDDAFICNNERASPSCESELDLKVQGCCNDHDGVDYVDLDGTVMCNDLTASPSCKFPLCDKS